MKRAITILIIFLVFPMISAVQIDLKSEYSQGETLIAKISGNIVSKITEDNVYFYRKHINVPMKFDILKIEDEYYISTSLDKNPDNYSIVMKDVEYYVQGGETSTEEFSADFKINDGYADFSVKPGVLISEQPFSLELQNLQASEIEVYFGNVYTETSENQTSNETEDKSFFEILFGEADEEESTEEETPSDYDSITLKEGEIRNIPFEFNDLSLPTLKPIELSTENTYYKIPAYILKSSQQENDFYFTDKLINLTLEKDSGTTSTITIKNNLEDSLNLNLNVSSNLIPYISLPKTITIENNSMKEIKLNISSINQSLNGELIAESSDFSFSSLIYLNVVDDIPSEKKEGKELPSASKTCEELNGSICEDNKKCSGEQVNSKDGTCCIGECEDKSSSSLGKIIGWGIIVVLLGLYFWFYQKKYKGTKRNVNLLKRGRKGIFRTKTKER